MSAQLSFLDQNLSQPEQVEQSQQTFDTTVKKPYTQVPNRYIDKIQKTLTPSENHVCMIILRRTYGWHRKAAKISMKEFMAGIYKERVIGLSKAHLLEMGLLKKCKDGYYIDIFYDQLPYNETRPEPKSQEIPVEQIIPQENLHSPELNQELQIPVDNPTGIPCENSTYECQGDVDNSTIPEPSVLQNSAETIIVDPPEVLSDQVQNKQSKKADEKKFSVCFDISIQTDMEYNHANALVSKYGIDKCLEKLEILKNYRKEHALNNPAGFFTNSLKFDWIPPKTVRDKLEIRLRTERQIQKSHQEFDDFERMKADRELADEFVASKRASMSDSELGKLNVEARQWLLDNGANFNLLSDFDIERQVNTILLNNR